MTGHCNWAQGSRTGLALGQSGSDGRRLLAAPRGVRRFWSLGLTELASCASPLHRTKAITCACSRDEALKPLTPSPGSLFLPVPAVSVGMDPELCKSRVLGLFSPGAAAVEPLPEQTQRWGGHRGATVLDFPSSKSIAQSSYLVFIGNTC